jgi:hypothetical protein
MNMLTRLMKKNKSEQNLASAAAAIVGLERTLAEKEEEVDGLSVSLEELYQAATLGKKDKGKISKTKDELAERGEDIAGLKSVINTAKTEAVALAETEIEMSISAKSDLQEQLKMETAEENKKMLATLRELLTSIYRLHGIRGAISKTPSFRISISTDAIPDEDITMGNKELVALYDSMTTGPHIISEQIREIEKKIAKAEPNQLVEKALQNARPASPQNESTKAA